MADELEIPRIPGLSRHRNPLTMLDDESLRYGPRGKVAHVTHSENDVIRALCGVQVYTWYGTGTQSEIEVAAGLPVCAHCHMDTIKREGRRAARDVS